MKSDLPLFAGGNTRFFSFGGFTFFLDGFFGIRSYLRAADSITDKYHFQWVLNVTVIICGMTYLLP